VDNKNLIHREANSNLGHDGALLPRVSNGLASSAAAGIAHAHYLESQGGKGQMMKSESPTIGRCAMSLELRTTYHHELLPGLRLDSRKLGLVWPIHDASRANFTHTSGQKDCFFAMTNDETKLQQAFTLLLRVSTEEFSNPRESTKSQQAFQTLRLILRSPLSESVVLTQTRHQTHDTKKKKKKIHFGRVHF